MLPKRLYLRNRTVSEIKKSAGVCIEPLKIDTDEKALL
jgi:hypothetical protein